MDAQNTIDKATETLVNHSDFKNASISLAVMDVESGQMVSTHNPDLSISPASSMKVITTATALAVLGKDFRFKTELQYDGEITNDGILKGNIYIKGFGDPTLGADKPAGTIMYPELMQRFVTAIQKKGIKRIEGKVIGDATYYQSQQVPDTWQWNDLGNYYGAGVSALNIHANTYEIIFRKHPSVGGQPTIKTTVPKLHNVLFVNELESAGARSGDNCYIYGAPYQNVRFLRGTIPSGSGEFRVKGSLPDPAFYTASLLLEALESAGVETPRKATTIFALQQQGTLPDGTRNNMFTHQSEPLFQIAKITNEESINLYCEALLRAIGKRLKNDDSLSESLAALKEFWEARGIDLKGFFMSDGSGLSPRNGVSAKHFVMILKKMKSDKNFDFDFQETLAISGQTGTMKWMFKNTDAAGRIFAKTGSMDRIRSYTGYAKSKSGRLLSFSVIVNNYNGSSSNSRKKLEQWMRSLITY